MLKSKKFKAAMLCLLLTLCTAGYMIGSTIKYRSKAAVQSIVPNQAAEQQVAGQQVLDETVPQESKEQEKKAEIVKYVVKSGDTLESIASTYNIKVSSITASNNITTETLLKEGQELRFPSVSGVIHKVRDGETVWDIADAYDVDAEAIVSTNNMSSPDKLKIGQELIIEGAEKVMAVNTQSTSSKGVSAKSGSVKVASRSAGSSGSSNSAGIIWPLRGIITSVFGLRDGKTHKGIDIAAPTGTNVSASMSGKVTYSGWENGYGNLVVISHGNGLETYYGHNSKLIVKAGQYVSRGQLISKVGSTGDSTGPHLHFEIRKGGTPVNPYGYLK
jgi:Membrane proteins related to metalloendopeptidases